ncbi:carbohydrate ABC transporter permease [Indioceanicola profundi]|uniref:carbohydrate ABC transporter permease n=1 Tax=Indioceanicola profundi TaxID=2220096 RepID=UPI001969107C|nr:sugar ABC transporter permease [Indioceanicola profundi]
MKVRQHTGYSALLGLLAGLVVLLAAGLWFAGQTIQSARQDAEARKATVSAMSLADMVGALQAAGAEPEQVRAAVETWRRGDPGIRAVRLIRQSGAQLVYSDVPADLEKGDVPRRLSREEKPLFDLANALRANVDSNAGEGIKRLPEIELAAPAADRLGVSVPVYAGDSYWGLAQVERERAAPAIAAGTGLAVGMALGGLVLMAAAVLALRRRGGAAASRWTLFAIAAVLLLGTAALFVRTETGRVADARNGQIAEVQQVVTGLRGSAAEGAGIVGAGLGAGAWDVDIFRRPLGQISPTGEVEDAAVRQALTGTLDGLGRQLWLTAALALGITAFFALGAAGRLAGTVREHRDAYVYVLPAILGMLFLVFFPFTYGVMLSFTERTLFNQSVPLTELWVGFANYAAILGDFDVIRTTPDGWSVNYESFYWTLFITVCWTVANVAIGVAVGLALALALNTEGLRGKAVYRVLLILPWAIPNYITALTWKGMFHQQFGVINQAIMLFGGEPIAWFDSVFSSFMTGVITNGWLSFPFMMVVSLGALSSIPSDMYEAAQLDGATRWQQFWNITLPLLKPALIPAIILSVVWTFNMFNVIYLVSGGEPAGANEILITKAYKLAFERYQYAYAAAYSFVIFLILLGYGVFQNRVSRATEQVR